MAPHVIHCFLLPQLLHSLFLHYSFLRWLHSHSSGRCCNCLFIHSRERNNFSSLSSKWSTKNQCLLDGLSRLFSREIFPILLKSDFFSIFFQFFSSILWLHLNCSSKCYSILNHRVVLEWTLDPFLFCFFSILFSQLELLLLLLQTILDFRISRKIYLLLFNFFGLVIWFDVILNLDLVDWIVDLEFNIFGLDL